MDGGEPKWGHVPWMPIPERHSRHGKWVEKIPAYFCGTLVECAPNMEKSTSA